ncbi:hypothetical protein [Natrarchaeobius oligotrophus]|uniref:Uncharacterized protein n=1 Tax=Natrarchaeobius chitinivorans TaxID=1679083 RepID=A0A3N6MF89_NATCH|nr:hypothetical protein [Natrarchaeobius chitinivorans]RQH02694.1 hypothetical protein EA472_05070 [Natrarchaeobius chitinivorans]
MKRYETKIDGETLYVEGTDDWLEVGSLNDVYELVGGETYTIEYDQAGQLASWVETDDEGAFTFDVRETLAEFTFEEEFVTNLARVPVDDEDDDGYPHRTAFFADMMTTIWDAKGSLETAIDDSDR